MKICYVPKKFSAGSMAVINAAEAIMSDYAKRGYDRPGWD